MGVRFRDAEFVGRAAELGRLRRALVGARGGRPTMVLVGGDAGVGKSRLMDQFASDAREDGARVIVGGCLELSGGGLPYGAMTEALRGLCDEFGVDELRRLAGDDLLDLRRVLPDLGPPGHPHAGGQAQPEFEPSSQQRSLEAFLGLVERLARDAPLVIILEDAHWADASTRDLLLFLARKLREIAVIVVVTFRTDELRPDGPFRRVLATLARSETVERIELEPFDIDGLARLLEAVLRRPPGLELVQQVFDRSRGNAFFAEQLLEAGGAHDELPVALSDVLLVGLDRLPASVIEVLKVLAVAGGQARHGLLARVTELDDLALEAALRVAGDRRVVVVDLSRGTYSFRHALLSEAVCATLLPSEHDRLHAGLAAAIEAEPRLAVRSAATELAFHWRASGDRSRTFVASLEAARAVEAGAGVAEARWHIDHALAVWSEIDDASVLAGLEHHELLAWGARLAHLAGDADRAVELQDRAVREHEGTRTTKASLLERLGRFRWLAGDSKGAEAAHAEAVALTPPDPPTVERARMLSSYSQLLMLELRHAESDVYGRRALDMARAVSDRAVESHALNTIGTNLAVRGDERGLELIRRARAIGEEIDSPDDVLRGYMNESGALLELGWFDEAIDVASRGLDRARHLGVERLWAGSLSQNIASAAIYVGRWVLADDVLRVAPRDVGGVGTGWAHLTRADLVAARGSSDVAREELAIARRQCSDVNAQTRDLFLRVQLAIAMLDGDTGPALAAIDARPSVRGRAVLSALELRAWILRALGDLAEAAPAGLMEAIHAECHALARSLGDHRRLAPVWLALADAEYARARHHHDAAARWDTALRRCEEVGLVYHAALARTRLARTLLDDRSPTDVPELVQAARVVASRLGARPLLRDVDELARRPDMPTTARGGPKTAWSEHPAGVATGGATVPSGPRSWTREGAVWALTFDGPTIRLPDMKGLADIAVLLSRPGREVPVIELLGAAVESRDLGPVLDAAARRSYEQRIIDLQGDLEEAESFGDLARIEHVRDELDRLIEGLAAATGLGGRTRRPGASTERARSAVTHRIRDAIRRIAELDPALGQHLTRSIRTGRWCAYEPADRGPPWTVSGIDALLGRPPARMYRA